MTPRARRLAAGIALLVIALFIGRWTADFLTERWWAASISPGAAAAVTQWRLLGLLLDAVAMGTAACWFALQAVVVARAIASVQVARQVGDLRLRETIPARLLLAGAVATGVLLGLITGAGAREWRAPIALAWQGVHYGLRDPLLREDLGVFVGQLPLWDVAHGFLVLLVVVGCGFVTMLYAGIGAIRRDGAQLVVHPYARRHLGLLLVALAAVIALGYLLTPYHLLVTPGAALNSAGALTRIRAAQVMVGMAAGIGLLSLLWIRRGRHTLLAGGWLVLGLGAVVERVIVPAVTGEGTPAVGSDAMVRHYDALAWGMIERDASLPADSIPTAPAVWDANLLARFAEANDAALLAATQTSLPQAGGTTPAWLVAIAPAGDHSHVDLLAVQEGMATPGGPPALLRPEEPAPGRPVWRSLAEVRLHPRDPAWREVPVGVPVGGPLRRLLLAWSRQGGGLLVEAGSTRIDWHLDPAERAAAILPMARWLPADVVLVAGRPTWVVEGLIGLENFPFASRATFQGTELGGLVPGFVATMDPVSGAVRFYLDPGADSAAVAWAGFAPELVLPASAMPAELRGALAYPSAWFETQLEVLETAAWGLGRRPGRFVANGPPAPPLPAWRSPGQPARQVSLNDPGSGLLSAVVTVFRSGGLPSMRVEDLSGGHAPTESTGELQRLWGQMLPLMHLRDSARAAGDTIESGAIRWFLGGGGLGAWQPIFAIPAHGPPTLLWTSTLLGPNLGGGRSMAEAWVTVRHPAGAPAPAVGNSDAATLRQARLWMLRADSAMARGDLTAFGRAIEELRTILRP